MIIEKGGRARSFRTLEEEDAALKKELESLTPDERDALMLMLSELEEEKQDGEQTLIDLVSEAEYKHAIVDIETFIKDPYYLGNTCEALYDQHVIDLKELFSGGYQEAIWTGAIGYGKTFVASVAVARVIYEISCLKDPHRSFGVAPGSNISLVCLSVNEGLAMKVAFENIATKLKASPYFQENFPFKETKKEFRFPNSVWLAARATTDTSVLGLNVISGLLDETNFMDKGRADARFGSVDHAETIYAGMRRRMKSRFERRGKLPGMLFLVSSKTTTDDFTSRRIRESKDDPTVFVRDYSLWDVKPEEYYSADKFLVICGNEQVHSRIIDKEEEEVFRKQMDDLPDGITVVDVPEDFRLDFERDIEGAIRDIAGMSTVAISPFIQRRERLVPWDKHPGHPFSVEVWDPSKPGNFVWERMVMEVEETDFSGYSHKKLRPIVNPTAARHIHIDPAYRKDRVGFCMGHVADWTDVTRRTEDGAVYQERAPIFHIDVILQIVPPVGDEIVLGDIRRLVYQLADHGYIITGVSMDTWQSVDALQQLKAKGFNSEHLSVDTQMDPYNCVKDAFYEGRVRIYDYAPVFKELRALEKDEKRNKVDHPPKGSKDVSDALAGCLFKLKMRNARQPLPIMRGLSYSPDAWMDEQLQHSMALHQGSNRGEDGRYYPGLATRGGVPQGMLPPFLGGGSGSNDDDGGWSPL
jgi:hypothetical protein